MDEPVIYAYTDFLEYLREWFRYKKGSTSHFSFASFSLKAGFKSRSFIQAVLKGDRKISSKSLFQMIEGLQLNEKEAHFFEALVDFRQAPSHQEKELHWKRIRKLGKSSPQAKLRSQEYDFFKEWYLAPLREVICNLDLKFNEKIDYQSLAHQLTPKISRKQAEEGFSLLKDLNLIVAGDDGYWTHSEQHVQASPITRSLAVREFQRINHKLAQESLDRFKRQERNSSTITLGTDEDGFRALNELIQEFQENVIKIVEEGHKVQRVFQLNLQLFPVSKILEKNK